MLDIQQLDKEVIIPVLKHLGMNSLTARRLMIGTALTESNLKYIKQINGIALGIWQVEPNTHDDIHKNYLYYRPELLDKIISLTSNSFPKSLQMIGNLNYSCAIARLVYWRSPKSLPDANDPLAMAQYHKEVYNTILGATDVNESVKNFKRAIKEIKE